MAKYYIYHIPGVKVGVSVTPYHRVKGQGYTNYEILEVHTDIDEVSKREIELQIEYGYGRDCTVTYKSTLKSFKRKNLKILKKDLENLYNIQKYTIPDIAQIYNCNKSTISKYLIHYKIPIRISCSDFTYHISYERLYDLYVNKKLTIIEIHRLTNRGPSYIKKKLEEFNIPQKSPGKSISLSVRRKKEYSEDNIIKLYKKGYSLRKIGRLTDYGRHTVGKIIKEYNIKDPEREFINKIKNDVIKLNSQGYSERKLSRDFNTTRGIIRKILKKNSPE